MPRRAFLHLLCLLAALALTPATADADETAMVVTILGSGTPIPSKTQFGAAILVEAGGDHFLFDCGRGCTTRMAELDPALIAKVRRLFVTHLHSDHLMGIDDLWLNGWVNGRTTPLTIWGPVGTRAMMAGLRAAFAPDVAFRTADGVPAPSRGLDDDVHELPAEGAVVHEANGVRILAFPVSHGVVKPAYGYRIDYRGRSLLISGDTTETPTLITHGKGVDVMLLEVMSPALEEHLRHVFQPAQVESLVRYHLTAEQASKVLAETSPRLGIYYHTRNDGIHEQTLVATTRKTYAGSIAVAHDLMQIRLGADIIVADKSHCHAK